MSWIVPRIVPLLAAAAAAVVVGAGVFWVATRPDPVDPAVFAALTGTTAAGERIFNATGCASCHAAEKASGEERVVLSGGKRFDSEFGTFIAPNISPGAEEGIGTWTLEQFANAVQRGVTPAGSHYYPALPYTTYIRMTSQDVTDLYAYMRTLPPSATPSAPHEVGFPFSIRRLVGGWKLLFLDDDWIVTGALTPQQEQGRYLVEAMGHCGECHTPRNALGASDTSRWLAGAPNPSGKGSIPNITPAALTWSEDEIAEYLTSGMTPDYDSVGGSMAEVVDNLSRLPAQDRAAIAAYLKTIPPVK